MFWFSPVRAGKQAASLGALNHRRDQLSGWRLTPLLHGYCFLICSARSHWVAVQAMAKATASENRELTNAPVALHGIWKKILNLLRWSDKWLEI
jgi:hypothetical protein